MHKMLTPLFWSTLSLLWGSAGVESAQEDGLVEQLIVPPPKSPEGEFVYDYATAPPLNEIVSESAVVARVRIISQSPKMSQGDIPKKCGNVYRAEVIDSIKGPTGVVEFFAVNDHSIGPGNEHALVFLKKRSAWFYNLALRHLLSNALLRQEYLQIECRLSNELFVPADWNTMVFFDHAYGASNGGEWIGTFNSPQIQICDEINGNVIDEDKARQRSPGAIETAIIKWDFLRRLLVEVSASARKLPKC
jgi:hypothetical protein